MPYDSRGPAVSRAAIRKVRNSVDILYLLIPLSIVMAFVIGAVFWWAARDGQFDDLEGPAHRILMDDESPQQSTSTMERR